MKLESDEEPSGKMLQCSQCPKTFKYNSERIRHEMSHSPGFECEVCCKKFSFVSALRRHQKQHERTGSVKCEECNRTFRDEVLLKRHVRYAHNGTFACSKCSGTFSSEQALRTHAKCHRPAAERRFKCSFEGCGKSFNFSHHLRHHELAHNNDKQHYCSVCGKGFIQSHHLKTHLKTHDPAEWLYCGLPGCNKKFATEYAKKRHMAFHKVKPDSGISSDSNSCDASVSSRDTEDCILCASCGENVDRSNKHEHAAKCGDVSDISTELQSCKIGPIEIENLKEQASLKKEVQDSIEEKNNFKEVKSTDKYNGDVGDCKSALGDCLMGANSCVCAQMSKPMEDTYDFTPINNDAKDNATVENDFPSETDNNIDFIERYSGVILNLFDNKENEAVLNSAESVTEPLLNTKPTNNVRSMCEGCECVSTCTIEEPMNCNGSINTVKVKPNVYTVGGVVKIKDTFDIDIPLRVDSAYKADNKVPNDFVSFSTCRDVIGNCIVGGNEGCLCARMMMDEQQAMAQEIDDITPVPKTECYT